MNSIFFLLPFLIVLSLGIYQDTFALETIVGYDYFDVENPDGTRTWTSHSPYVFDGNNYVPFIANGNTITTHLGNVVLNPDGSYTWTEKGITDRIVGKYADISDLNSWTYPNTLNNDTPDNSWDGSALVSSKVKAGIGQLDYKYVLDHGRWKTQLEVTNLSSLNTKVFGFDEIVDINSDTISFGGTVRNLDNFNNTTFDKEFLIANKGKVLNLLNNINFDFDKGFENLYSITVYDTGANKSRLVFDYRTSGILPPNEKLIIDPTFTGTETGSNRVFTNALASVACDPTFNGQDNVLNVFKRASTDATLGSCQAPWFTFDVSSIVGAVSVTAASIEYDVYSVSNPENCDWLHLDLTPGGDQTTMNNLLKTGALYTVIDSNDSTCTTVADGKVDVFNSASYPLILSDINGDGVVAIGLSYNSWVRDALPHQSAIRDADAVISITYSLGSPPNPVTVLNDANLSTNSLDLVWDAPTSFGSGTFQTYTINYTTPHGDPVTFLANSTNLYYNVTGLTFGTDYSFRVAARTEVQGNNTGAYILNITTTSNTYSLPPTSLVATSNSATQIDLQWVASTIQNILGYKIERETPSGTGWATIVANTTNTNNYYNNTGLTSNIIYNYRVSAMNATGFSTVSNTYKMTTYHLPDAVTDLTGSATDLSTIDLSWTAPTSYAPAITGYMINGTTPTGEPVDILNSNTGTSATTATALNLLIGQEYSFRVSPITVHGKNATGNIWNGSTIQTFVIGNLSNPDITNDDDFSIFFDRTDINASAIQLDVTYPNSYNLSCDFDYKYAMINQTYSSLTTVPDGTDDQTATFTLINATGDLVQVRCWDTITGDESTYVITITDFPFLEQIQSLRNGDYGTFFQIGAFDGVMLIIIFLGMVGLNRTTPIVGIIFVVITTLTMSYFQLITYPIIMYPALIMMIVWAFVTTRKDD